MKPSHKKYILIYITTVLYFFLFYDYGINLWDEGISANGALRVLNGERVSRDFLGYAPGRYYLFSFCFYLFGTDLLIIRKVMVLLTGFMPLLGYLISKEIMGKYFALLPFFLVLSAPAVYYNRFFPFFSLVNICLLILYFKNATRSSFAVIIISIAVTLLFRMDIGLISLFCLLSGTVVRKQVIGKQNISFTAVGLVSAIPLALLLFILYLLIPQDLLTLLQYRAYHVFLLHQAWGNPFPTLFSPDLLPSLDIAELSERLLYYLPLPLYLLSIFMGIKIKDREKGLSITIIAIFGICTFGLVIWRAGFDNLVRVLPPFYILGCYFLSLWYDSILRWIDNVGKTLSLSVKKGISTLSVSVAPLFLTGHFLLNHGFYAGSIGAMKKKQTLLSVERAPVFVSPSDADWIEEIVGYIKENTKEDDYIFAVPLNPLWYFLTNRKNPTFYEWILPGTFQNSDKGQEEVIEALKKKKPKVVILADVAIDGKEDRRFLRYANHLYDYLTEAYQVEQVTGFFYIMRLIDE